MVGDTWANLEMFSAISVLGLAAILATVSVLSWIRLRHPRALFIALGFLSLAAQGAYLVAKANATRGATDWLMPVAAMDLVALVFLYAALRVR